MIYKSILLILGYLYGTMLTATFVVKHSTGNDVSKIGSGNPGMANDRISKFTLGISEDRTIRIRWWLMSWNISGKRKVFWY